LGGADFEVSSLAQQHPSDRVLAEEIRAAREDLTIIALGPLTNLARAFVRDPSLIASVGQLIIMGGSIEQGGNVTPAAEFNIFCDPASAQTVFKSRTTKTLVPLDATNPVLFSYDFLDQLPPESTRAGAFLRRILPFAFRSHRRELGLEGIHLHDAVAVAAALAPGLFTTTAMAGAVETSGEVATGATVFDRRMVRQWRPNMDVVTETDVAAVKDCIIRGLAEAGRQT
jgi:purine nucleosidase